MQTNRDRGRRVGVIALAVMLAGGAASAQHHNDEPREARVQARRGTELQAAGRHAEAIEAFRAAGLASNQPRFLALIGLNEAALDRWVAAYRDLNNALRFGDDPWIARNQTTLRAELERVRAHVAWVRLEGTPAGARVSVNGVAVGSLPISEDLLLSAEESVQIEVSAEAFQTSRRTVSLVAGEVTRFRVTLQPLPARVRLMQLPEGAWARVDGGERHLANEAVEVPAGEHDVQFGAAGYVTQFTHVVLRPGETHQVVVRLERDATPEPASASPTEVAPSAPQAPAPAPDPAPTPVASSTGRTVMWVGLGIAAASAVGAGVLVALGSSAESDYNAQCRGATMAPASCVALRDERQAALDTYSGGSFVFATAAGLGVIAALSSLLFTGPSQTSAGTSRTSAAATWPRLLVGANHVGLRVAW